MVHSGVLMADGGAPQTSRGPGVANFPLHHFLDGPE